MISRTRWRSSPAAASGIGAAVARSLAADGARVLLADLDIKGAEDLADEIKAAGGTASAVETNVADAVEVEAMVETARRTYGACTWRSTMPASAGRRPRRANIRSTAGTR